MAIPSYTSLLLPLLQLAGDGQEHKLADAVETLADYVGLTAVERVELTPNGHQYKFNHRVRWAAANLRHAGLLNSDARGTFYITPLGVEVLRSNPLHIDRAFLMQFPQYADYATRQKPDTVNGFTPVLPGTDGEQTPKETLYTTYQMLRQELADDVLEMVRASSPAFFEKLVLDVLLAMGYGGSRESAGRRIGQTGDGGIDGYIFEDKLGLDVICIQAKKWAHDHTVGRPVVQNFIGSIIGASASKGVLMTTSSFTKQAIEYARSVQNYKIILIDGQQLAQLMIEHGVGVSVEETYIVKNLDRDYFDIG